MLSLKLGRTRCSHPSQKDRSMLTPVLESPKDSMVGTKTGAGQHQPGHGNAFWDKIRASLRIDDGEIETGKSKVVSQPPRRLETGKKTLVSRLGDLETYHDKVREDKRRISMMPSAERK